MIRTLLFSLLSVPILLLSVSHAHALAKTCAELKRLNAVEIEIGKASPEAFQDCMIKGEDPPKHLIPGMGARSTPTSVGSTGPSASCSPEGKCPNSKRELEDGGDNTGYFDARNPKLNIPPVPWGKVDERIIPCGAIAKAGANAILQLLGKVKVGGKPISGHLDTAVGNVNGKFNELDGLLNQLRNGVNVPVHQVEGVIRELNGQINGVISQVQTASQFPQTQYNTMRQDLRSNVRSLVNTANDTGTLPQDQLDTTLDDVDTQMGEMLSNMLADSAVPDSQKNYISARADGLIRAMITTAQNESRNVTQAEVDNAINSISGDVNSLLNTTLASIGNPQEDMRGALDEYNQAASDLIGHLRAGAAIPQGQMNALLAQLKARLAPLQGAIGAVDGLVAAGQRDFNQLRGNITQELNNRLVEQLSSVFKDKDCQDGKFWGVVNYLMKMFLDKGKYTFDAKSSSFISDSTTYVTLPLDHSISLQPANGAPKNNFILPAGGSFRDMRNNLVRLPPGSATNFRSDGLVRVSTGDQYRVNPRGETVVNPNGVLAFPPGTRIPVDKNDKIYPAGPTSEPPSWYQGEAQ